MSGYDTGPDWGALYIEPAHGQDRQGNFRPDRDKHPDDEEEQP